MQNLLDCVRECHEVSGPTLGGIAVAFKLKKYPKIKLRVDF